jgi:hypothetical protein
MEIIQPQTFDLPPDWVAIIQPNTFGFHPERMEIIQPSVATQELPWVHTPKNPNPERVESPHLFRPS